MLLAAPGKPGESPQSGPLKFLGADDDENKIGHQGNAGDEDDDFSHPLQPPAEMCVYQAN